MKKKQQINQILIDLGYNGNFNEFEEFYGESVSYQEIEQHSYIELKNMVNQYIGKVKFRKARDISFNNKLTCKIELNETQYEKFKSIYEGKELDILKTNDKKENPEGENIYKKFFFVHNFKISNLRFFDDQQIKFDDDDEDQITENDDFF